MLVGNRSKDEVDTSEITSLLDQFPANTNVLIVDTNFTSLLNMKRIMRKYAYQVTIEADAEKALAFLTSCKHDINIVIWDYHMPEIDGVQALKSIASKLDLPVIIMSDDNQTESVMKATVHGACDYVLKPVKEDILANIWQHIVRKTLMSKPEVSPPVQSVLAQSDGLEHGKVDFMIVDQEQNIDNKEEREAKRSWPTWTGAIQPVHSDLFQINVLDQQNEYSIAINQDNGEQYIGEKIEGAAKGPWTGEIQPVQVDLVQINVLDQHNYYSKTINQDNGEQNIHKKEERVERRPWMTWTGAHQPFQSDLVQLNDLIQHNHYSNIITQDKSEQSIGKKDEKAAKKPRMRAEEIQLVQSDDSNDGNSVEIIDKRVWKKTRKQRMKWTKDLHNKFLEAIEIIGGIGKANPKVLLECLQGMKIQGLTKSNVASHLQKHRIYLDENQIPQQTQKIGWSTGYGAVPYLQGSNNVHTAISPYLMNDPAVNPIQQNQYQNGAVNPIKQNQYQSGAVNPIQQIDQYHDGYLTMNKNSFITNPLPRVPYFDHQPHQPQQQQYQSSPQYNYLMSNEEPGKASDIYAPHLELTYQSLPYM